MAMKARCGGVTSVRISVWTVWSHEAGVSFSLRTKAAQDGQVPTGDEDFIASGRKVAKFCI